MVQSLQNLESIHYATSQSACTTLCFTVWDNSVKIDVPLNQECFIGRSSQEELLAVDLTPFNAHVLGVSRKHAMLKPVANGCCLIDFKSTNGTLLNGNPLVPHQPYLLKSGDEIQIGGVYLHVSFY
jgi:pSer/pThr/pTyr-binding forkhead associated (FHA) protein